MNRQDSSAPSRELVDHRGARARVRLAAAALALTCGCSLVGVRTYEQQPYEVLRSDGAFEVRRYPEALVAETEVRGDDYDERSERAFERLADYIFGENTTATDIDMTGVVAQRDGGATGASDGERAPGRDIDMTAPVRQVDTGDRQVMTFFMPAGWSADTLPRPLDPAVTIRTLEPRTIAVRRFSGCLDAEAIADERRALEGWMAAEGLEAEGPLQSAGYDPPWTIPFLRRNEVWVPVRDGAG